MKKIERKNRINHKVKYGKIIILYHIVMFLTALITPAKHDWTYKEV